MVITLFRSELRADIDQAAYEAAFGEMYELASQMPGFISIDGYSGSDGSELAVVCFESEETLRAWREHPEHVKTQERARAEFYTAYQITVAEVTRSYVFPAPDRAQ
jgi:heme-degrading monooxygenase HmoA